MVGSSRSGEDLGELRRLPGRYCDRADLGLVEDERELRAVGVEEVVRDGTQTEAARREVAHGEL